MKRRFCLFLALLCTAAVLVGCNSAPKESTAADRDSSAPSIPAASAASVASSGVIVEGNSEMLGIDIEINGVAFAAALYDNETSQALLAMLPLTLTMDDLLNNEKCYYFGSSLPTAPQGVGTIHEGDIMLFGGDCLVLFYDTFPTGYNYTPIGRLDKTAGLADCIGTGEATVTFKAKD